MKLFELTNWKKEYRKLLDEFNSLEDKLTKAQERNCDLIRELNNYHEMKTQLDMLMIQNEDVLLENNHLKELAYNKEVIITHLESDNKHLKEIIGSIM